MKKLGKRLSFLTKVLLVVGLLISNLSSLSVVFAYEVSESVVINLVDDNLKISYTDKIAEDVKGVKVKVYEAYTYLNGLSEDAVVNTYTLDESQMALALDGKLELEHKSIFAPKENENGEIEDFKLFDGTYNVRVEIIKVTPAEVESQIETQTQLESENENSVENQVENQIESQVEPGIENQVGTQTENQEEQLQNLSLTGSETQIISEPTEEIIVTGEYEKEITYKNGLNIKLFNSNNEEIIKVNGKFPVAKEDPNVRVVAKVLGGKLSPTDIFVYNGQEYFAKTLLEKEIEITKSYDGYLYGEYNLPIEVKVSKQLPISPAADGDDTLPEGGQYEDIVYTDDLSIMYGTYELNADNLNNALTLESLDDTYKFYSNSKDGILYVYLDLVNTEEKSNTSKTMLDLYTVIDKTYGQSDKITYQLLKNGVDVFAGYDASTATQTVNEYLAGIIVDETVVVSLVCDKLNVTYKVLIVADFNNDGILDEKDLSNIIEQVTGTVINDNKEKADFNGDGKVDALDVLYLNQIIKNLKWDVNVDEVEATLDADTNVIVDSERNIVSGDEFTIEYVLSLSENEVSGFSGLLEYDEDVLELVSIKSISDWLGNYNKENGKFFYLGEESLSIPTDDSTDGDLANGDDSSINAGVALVAEEENQEETNPEVITEEHVVLTVKFRALKSGIHTVKIKNNEYFNDATYLTLKEKVEPIASVLIEQSDDNTLSYLEVAGQVINLEEGIFEYEINVTNDVTLVDLKYTLSNVAAEVTSLVYPEGLVEGKNAVVITVTSESGISQDYTIIVNREESKKEEVVVDVDDNYYGDYEKEEEEIIVTPAPEEKPIIDVSEEEKEEKSIVSKVVIIVLILSVIGGLVYLIFRDEDSETKKANKDINKLKKDNLDGGAKAVTASKTATVSKPVNKSSGNSSKNKNNKKKNGNKKER